MLCSRAGYFESGHLKMFLNSLNNVRMWVGGDDFETYSRIEVWDISTVLSTIFKFFPQIDNNFFCFARIISFHFDNEEITFKRKLYKINI